MHAVVTQVEVQVVPFGSEARAEPWDLFSGPDLYYKVYGPDGTHLYTSDAADDVQPQDLPVRLEAGFAVEETGSHLVQLLDADLMEDEVVGQVDFSLDRIGNRPQERPSTRTLRLQDGETTLQLVVEWKGDPS